MSSSAPPEFAKIQGQLSELHSELSILSKQKPNDAVNAFKLQFINQLLDAANSLLRDEYHPFVGFTTFDGDAMPTNSDVVLILSQYIKCMHRQAHIDKYGSF